MAPGKMIPVIVSIVMLASAGSPGARGPHGDSDTAQELARAEALYAEGDLQGALEALDIARAAIVDEISRHPRTDRRPVNNADQILHCLDYYWFAASGLDPQRDREALFVGEYLELVVQLECDSRRFGRLKGRSVDRWADGRIRRIGDIDIDHWADGRIRRVGDTAIDYWADGRIHRIGDIDFDYRAGDDWPYRVADVDVD